MCAIGSRRLILDNHRRAFPSVRLKGNPLIGRKHFSQPDGKRGRFVYMIDMLKGPIASEMKSRYQQNSKAP